MNELPITGSFDYDIPKKILSAKFSQGSILVTVEWEIRSNGVKPENTLYTNDSAKE